MEAGRLRHRVTIEEKVESRDAYGGERETWVEYAEVWAEKSPLVGREYLEARQMMAEVKTKIRIRYLAGVRAEMRGVDGSQTYEIISPPIDVEGRQRGIGLMGRG